jgi:uncharacterized membrane protein required for colicin V production
MAIGTMDIFLLVIIVSTLIVGFFWGAARSLMLLAAWLLAFLAGAYLKLELGSYLARQWTNYPGTFSEMAAFGLIFMGMLVVAPVAIVMVTRGNQRISRHQAFDDFAGALIAVFVSVLAIAGLLIVLSTYYGPPETFVENPGGPEWTASLYQSLVNSSIGAGVNEHLVPLIGTVLGPILPADVREVFG